MPSIYRDRLPWNPLDTIGPPIHSAPVQVGAAGPIVIRSNPIGAVFDAIRGFCYPMPMDESAAQPGQFDSADGFGSPGTASYSPPPSDSGVAGGFTSPYPPTGRGCVSGMHWDSMINQCVPDGPQDQGSMDPCSQANLIAARASLTTARTNCDRGGMEQALSTARSCPDTTVGPRQVAWGRLVSEAQQAIAGYQRQCQSRGGQQPGFGPPPGRARIANQPAMADPSTLTEGNARMLANPTPMVGTIDPAAVIGRRWRPGFGRR